MVRKFVSSVSIFMLSFLMILPSLVLAGDKEHYKINPSETLALRDCVNIALGRSPLHLKTLETLSASRYDVLASYGVYTPSVNLSHSASQFDFTTRTFRNPDGTVIQLPDSLIVTDTARNNSRNWNFNINLLNGGRNVANILRARAQKHANEYGVDASKLQVVADVSTKYFDVLRSQKLIELNKKILEQREDQLRLAEARYNVGSVTKQDVLQAKIDKQRQDLELLRAENNLIAAKMELNRSIGIDINQTFNLQDEFEVFEPDFDVEGLIAFAMDNNPTIRQLESQEAALAKQVWMERGNYLPSISLSGTINKNEAGGKNDKFFVYDPSNETNVVNVSFNWQFYSGLQNLANERQAKVNYANSEHDLFDAQLTTESNIRQAHLELTRVYQNTLTMADNRELATQQLELASERYRLGSADILELRAAQSLFSQAEYDYISSMFDFHVALVNLSQAVGRDLTHVK